MTCILLLVDDDKTLEVDSVIETLMARFSETRVTAQDSFEAEHNRLSVLMQELARIDGRPIKNPQIILESLKNRESKFGPGKDISLVSDDGAVFTGNVWAKYVRLISPATVSAQTIESIAGILKSWEKGPVVVDGHPWP